MGTIKGHINPLKFADLDAELSGPSSQPSAQGIFNELFDGASTPDVGTFVRRYREIGSVRDPLFIAPAEPHIMSRLVWPLRNAKSCYALGNALGCIALCGMVGEMVAILLWEISKGKVKNLPQEADRQAVLFGRAFEKLGQERRIAVLRCLELIDETSEGSLERMRATRNRYLHLFSHPHDDLDKDAKAMFADALLAVEVVLGQTVDRGQLKLRSDLWEYLSERGVWGEESSSEPAT